MVEPSQAQAANALSQLTHCRWALPILAVVAQDGGAKLVTLSKRLGVSAPSLKRALLRLQELDLVIPNPGYGHPLRPEYILGAAGVLADRLPGAIVQWASKDDLAAEVLKKWQLPILAAMAPETSRFGEIRRQLRTASPRAVTLALKSQSSLGLITRDVDHGYPPVARYTPTALALPGREPALLLGAILAQSATAT